MSTAQTTVKVGSENRKGIYAWKKVAGIWRKGKLFRYKADNEVPLPVWVNTMIEPVTLTHLVSLRSGSTAYATFRDVDIGPPDKDRAIVIAVTVNRSTRSTNIRGIHGTSVNGVYIEKYAYIRDGLSRSMAIFVDDRPVGDKITIGVNCADGESNVTINVYALKNHGSAIPFDISTDRAYYNFKLGTDLKVPAKGVALSQYFAYGNGGTTWTVLTKDYESIAYGTSDNIVAVAYAKNAGKVERSVYITANGGPTISGVGAAGLCSISWGPKE